MNTVTIGGDLGRQLGRVGALAGAVAVSGLLLVGCCCGGNKTEKPSASDPGATTTTPTTPATPTAPPKPTVTARPQPKLGEEFRLGDFTYNVKKVETTDTAGSGYGAKKASDGAKYVIVKFTIRNESNDTKTVMTDDFRIVDGQNRQFRPSSEANTAIMMSPGGKDLIFSQLQPGINKNMVTAFEVPTKVADGEFDLVIPEKGFLGTNKVVITLK